MLDWQKLIFVHIAKVFPKKADIIKRSEREEHILVRKSPAADVHILLKKKMVADCWLRQGLFQYKQDTH